MMKMRSRNCFKKWLVLAKGTERSRSMWIIVAHPFRYGRASPSFTAYHFGTFTEADEDLHEQGHSAKNKSAVSFALKPEGF